MQSVTENVTLCSEKYKYWNINSLKEFMISLWFKHSVPERSNLGQVFWFKYSLLILHAKGQHLFWNPRHLLVFQLKVKEKNIRLQKCIYGKYLRTQNICKSNYETLNITKNSAMLPCLLAYNRLLKLKLTYFTWPNIDWHTLACYTLTTNQSNP